MTKVRAGYKLHVVDREGVLQGTVQLEGYDLDKPWVWMALVQAVEDALPAVAFESELESESKTEGG